MPSEEASITRFMFDTNIFNAIRDGKVSLSVVKGIHQYLVTHIQRDELEATRNEERRKELLRIFEVINQVLIPTESALWDVSKWDLSKWTKEDGMYERIFKRLEKEKPHDRGNEKDTLVGETAIKNGIVLVSNDRALREVNIAANASGVQGFQDVSAKLDEAVEQIKQHNYANVMKLVSEAISITTTNGNKAAETLKEKGLI